MNWNFSLPAGNEFVLIRELSGPLAQLVEQETLNLLVVGSNPTRPTKSPVFPRFLVYSQCFFMFSSCDGLYRAVSNRYNHPICESGGIGRRTGFRFQRGNP